MRVRGMCVCVCVCACLCVCVCVSKYFSFPFFFSCFRLLLKFSGLCSDLPSGHGNLADLAILENVCTFVYTGPHYVYQVGWLTKSFHVCLYVFILSARRMHQWSHLGDQHTFGFIYLVLYHSDFCPKSFPLF